MSKCPELREQLFVFVVRWKARFAHLWKESVCREWLTVGEKACNRDLQGPVKVREIQNTEGKVKVLYRSRLVHRYGCWTVREFLFKTSSFHWWVEGSYFSRVWERPVEMGTRSWKIVEIFRAGEQENENLPDKHMDCHTLINPAQRWWPYILYAC